MLGFTSSGHASKLYWHLLMTFTHLGASRCMNNAMHVHVRERERTHARTGVQVLSICLFKTSSSVSLQKRGRKKKQSVGASFLPFCPNLYPPCKLQQAIFIKFLSKQSFFEVPKLIGKFYFLLWYLLQLSTAMAPDEVSEANTRAKVT